MSARRARDISWSARTVSRTAMSAPGAGDGGAKPSATTAPQAPRSNAAPTKSWPSKLGPRSAKKRSPRSSVRVSMDTPVGFPRPSTSTRPSRLATSSPSVLTALAPTGMRDPLSPFPLPKQGASHLHIGEGMPHLPDLLVFLVAFSRDHDGVARPGLVERSRDRLAAIDDRHVRGAGLAEARLDVGEDRAGILAARVVGSEDREVGATADGAPHERALAAVSVPAASEDGDDPPGDERLEPGGEGFERVGRVRVVHDHVETERVLHELEAPRNRPRILDPLDDRLARQRERLGRRDRGERVPLVEEARERETAPIGAARS